MGGTGGRVSGKGRSGGGGASGSGGSGGGAGGAGGGASGGDCPASVRVVLSSTQPGIGVGDAAAARLSGGVPQSMIVVHVGSGRDIAPVVGVPDLPQLIRCLEAGASYVGAVDRVGGGAVEVTLWLR